MVTYCATKLTATCLTMIGQFLDTMIMALTDKYPSNSKSWKVLETVFRHLIPLTPVPPVIARDEPWLFLHFVIIFDQNWHHLHSTFAGGNDLSNDAKVRVIGLMEPEICTKMLKKMSEKLSKISCHYT